MLIRRMAPVAVALLALCCLMALQLLGLVYFPYSQQTDAQWEQLPKIIRQRSTKYLYYYSHSGFSNQLLGLARAAQLAHSTNRTLILPPILPHTKAEGQKARTAGGGCHPYMNSNRYIHEAKLDATNCRDHVKFSEIIDTAKLSRKIAVPFVDLCDFVSTESNLVEQYFLQTNEDARNHALIDLDGRCTLNYTRPYPDMVSYFQSIYSNATVAIIPSAFMMINKDHQTPFFVKNIAGYPLSLPLLELMNSLRGHLPLKYIGVHLRYTDEHKFDCSRENKRNVLKQINRESRAIEKTGNYSPSVFFASSSQSAVKCYCQFLGASGYRTLNLDNLLAQIERKGHENFTGKTIQVPTSVLYLVLDQILVSLGTRVVLEHRGMRSTFHMVITMRRLNQF